MFFFFNDTATTEIYTLSLHDALPISQGDHRRRAGGPARAARGDRRQDGAGPADRKSTRLNSSHANISYAVFCLKKKKKQTQPGQYNGDTLIHDDYPVVKQSSYITN